MKIGPRFWRTVFSVRLVLAKIYVNLFSPWIMARFNAAWTEYQQGPVYRDRLRYLGFLEAYERFSRWEQKYCLKLRRQKEPRLRWQILIAPYSVAVPEDLQIAARQGYFDKDAKA